VVLESNVDRAMLGLKLAPSPQHPPVYYINEGTLRIKCESFPVGSWIIMSSKEPSFPAAKANKKSRSPDPRTNPTVPLSMCWKRSEIAWLELDDGLDGELGFGGEGGGESSVV